MSASADKVTAANEVEEFTISRVFDAPRDVVWKAWTNAEALAKWWGPKGCTIRVIKLDFRLGGVFHYAMAYQPGHEMYGRFVYREIAAASRVRRSRSLAIAGRSKCSTA
jgi:uncharacterized protein YndB with AHSA1/START domain